MKVYIFIFCLLGAVSAQYSAARRTEKIAKANNDFSQRLYQQIAVGANNQIFSGYSIHVAMSLLSLGARGDTRTEIETSLGLNVFRSQTARNQAYSDVIEQIRKGKMKAYIFIFCLLGAASAQYSAARATEKIAKANNDFSQRLYQQIAVGANNQIFSGYSIHVAMSLLSLGARGDTRTEIETSLGLNVFRSQTARNQAYSDVIEQLNSAPKVKVLTANGVFVNQERTVRGAFVNDVRNYYQADVSTFDPRDPACPETVINDYVENKTQGLIRGLIPPNVINALTEVVVVNTIYFNASWQEPFSDRETRQADFFSAQGTIQVPTMFSTRTMKIKRNFYGADVGELALGDGRFSFVMLLPHNLNELEEQERSLTNPGRIKALFESLQPIRVNMSLPKFNIKSSYELTTPLKALGIIKAFDHEQANLTGTNSGGGIYISRVFHQTVIEVNETGIGVTTTTAVETSAVSQPPPPTETIKFGRPFTMLIIDNVQNVLIFQAKTTG